MHNNFLSALQSRKARIPQFSTRLTLHYRCIILVPSVVKFLSIWQLPRSCIKCHHYILLEPVFNGLPVWYYGNVGLYNTAICSVRFNIQKWELKLQFHILFYWRPTQDVVVIESGSNRWYLQRLSKKVQIKGHYFVKSINFLSSTSPKKFSANLL